MTAFEPGKQPEAQQPRQTGQGRVGHGPCWLVWEAMEEKLWEAGEDIPPPEALEKKRLKTLKLPCI